MVWIICISTVQLLGTLRTATDAELYVASLVLFPVLVMAWTGGMRSGMLMSFIGAATWFVSDIMSERQFSTWWLMWANSATRLLTYSLVAILTAKVRQQFESEHRNANCDALTGLNNRHAFLDAGASEVARAKRYNHPLAVVFMDLDNFKKLNDSKALTKPIEICCLRRAGKNWQYPARCRNACCGPAPEPRIQPPPTPCISMHSRRLVMQEPRRQFAQMCHLNCIQFPQYRNTSRYMLPDMMGDRVASQYPTHVPAP